MKIDHIGYAVRNIEKAGTEFKNLGYHETTDIITDEARNVRIQFFENDGYTIELVQPTNDDSPAAGVLKRNGESPYHICYITGDLEHTLEELTAQKYKIIQPPAPAPAINHCRVAFLYHLRIGLIEIIERK